MARGRVVLYNFLESIQSFLRNDATAARVWQLQDRSGTLADDTDIAGRVPITRTLGGLDLSANRSASEINVALGIMLSNLVTGSSNNRYHSSSLVIGGSSLSTASLGTNTFKASPLIVGKNVTVDRIQIEVTTLGASAKVRIGIYADNGSCYPGALLVDSGELDAGTTGFKTATISTPLTPGLYWLVCLGGTATATYRAEGTTCFYLSVLGFDPTSPNPRQPYYSVAQAYGALPANFPAGATINTSATNMPLIQVRY